MELEALLADEFIEIGRSGRQYSRAEIIHELNDTGATSVSIEDFTARHLAPEVALVRYRSIAHRVGVPDAVAWRCSIWECGDGVWRIAYHQGTPTS